MSAMITGPTDEPTSQLVSCEHVERGELAAFSILEHATIHGRKDGTYRFHYRLVFCALCAGRLLGLLSQVPR